MQGRSDPLGARGDSGGGGRNLRAPPSRARRTAEAAAELLGRDEQRVVRLPALVHLELEVGVAALELGDKEYDPLMAQRVPKARAILADLGVFPLAEARR